MKEYKTYCDKCGKEYSYTSEVMIYQDGTEETNLCRKCMRGLRKIMKEFIEHDTKM